MHNHMLSILQDAIGCVRSDKWHSGYREALKVDIWDYQLITDISCDDAGTVTTSAGTFENCLRVTLDVKGYKSAWLYRGGKMAYYFAPGVGIVRAEHNYKDDTLTSVYELTECGGAGDGYMPIADGLYRRYDAIGLTEGCKGSVGLTCAADPAGRIILFESPIGVKALQ
jgi:hypothetical protein